MKGHQVFANQHNASTHSEGLLDWFRDLHPTVQIALIFSMTTILIMLIFNPVAGGVLVSFLLVLRGIENIPAVLSR